MSVVLDTHAWLWFLNADPRLGKEAARLIEAATTGEGAVLSAISPWEISMLVAKQRLSLPRATQEWMTEMLSQPGFALHPLSIPIAVDSNMLPGTCHGDPADRIIIATARHLAIPLVTADRQILEYAAAGHLVAADATL